MRAKYSRKKYTLLNTSFGIANRCVVLITNFVLRTIFINYLGIEYTGVSAVFTDILTILSFAELGIGSAITYSLYKPIEQNDYKEIASIMHLYKIAYRLIAVFIFLVGFVLAPFINLIVPCSPNIVEDIRLIFLLYVFNSASSYLLIYKSSLLVASQHGYYQSLINSGTHIAKAVVQTILIIELKNFILFLIIEILFNVLNNIVVSYFADRCFYMIRKYPYESLSKDRIFGILKNVKALSIYRICGVITNGLTSMLVSALVSIEMVGYVSNYTLVIQQIYTFTLQFFNAATASIGNLAASKDKHRQETVFETLFCYGALFFCIFAVVLFNVLNDFIVDIWLGKQYKISITIVALLCSDLYLKGLASIFGTFRNANGLFRQGQYRPIIMVVLNIVGAFILYKIIGIEGIFVALVASRLITQTWFDPLILYRHLFKTSYLSFLRNLIRWFLCLLISAALSWHINSFIQFDNGYKNFITHGLISVVITILLAIIIFRKEGIIARLYQILHNSRN